MTTYRKYNKRQKLAVVMAADMVGVVQAEKQSGIPESTIRYWMQRPEFAEIRAKTREDLAEEIKVVAHLAWQRTAEALRDGTIEPRDILFAAEKATGLQLLMAGEATARSETRTWTDTLNDTEKQRLRDWIDGLDGPSGTGEPGETATDPLAVGSEVRQPAAEDLL